MHIAEPLDEMLACFDEFGNAAESHSRQEVHSLPLKYWHGVVNVWLMDTGGRIVCSKRSAGLSGNPGKWQTYFGGHVKAGGTFEETIVAELQEEVGITPDISKLLLVASGKKPDSMHFYQSYAYLFDDELSDLVFADGEVEEVRRYSMDEYLHDKEQNSEKWCNGITAEEWNKIFAWVKKN